MNYGQRFGTLYRRQEQDHPQEKETQKSKTAVQGGLTNSCEKKRSESKGEKERYVHLNAEFQRIARREKKAFLSHRKEIEENNRMGKTIEISIEISSRKLEIPREHFMQTWAQ